VESSLSISTVKRFQIKIGLGAVFLLLALIQMPKLKMSDSGAYEMGQWIGVSILLMVGVISLYSGWKSRRISS
jgi:hypothetical protein